MKKHIPNGLTFSRGLLTVAIIVLFSVPADIPGRFGIILFLFVLASLTDFLDGYFARKWKVISEWGIVFDSLLDKVLMVSLFFLLLPFDIFPAWLLLALIVRDLFIDGIKNYSLSKRLPISSIASGKWKFTFQVAMIFCALAYLALPAFTVLSDIAVICAYIALVLAYFSGFIYVRAFILAQNK